MKRSSDLFLWLAAGCFAAFLAVAPRALARSGTTTQDLTLTAGWNAVWLEVEPVYTSGASTGQPKTPQDVFTNPAIQVVASPKPLAGLSEFFAADPATTGAFNKDEWEQWKRTDPTGSNNLGLVFGNRPYLIQVAAGAPSFALNLDGKARFFRPAWIPNRYNLIGFGLEDGVTFDSFFGPSGAKHPVGRIFSLNPNGNWVKVTGGAAMVSNRAYWIFAAGSSDYMGPVAVDFKLAVSGELNFGGPGDAVQVGTGVDKLELDLAEVVFTNLKGASAVPPSAVPGLDLITVSGAGALDLFVVKPAAGSLSYARGNQVDSATGAVIPPATTAALGETVAPQASAILTLGARRTGTFGAAGRTHYYRLKTGAGSLVWLPVSARDSDLQADIGPVRPGASPAAGLWIGDVVLNAATSIVEDGAPSRPSAGTSPMRLLFHSDANGAVRLLSQVTIMQTKSADSSVPSAPVLVIDPAKIPFFEGIRERNGKRIGVRVEAVAYDMPRKFDAISQSALLSDPVYASLHLTAAGLLDFLVSRTTRPPSLKEIYDFSAPMTGDAGAGKTLTATLSMDPYHRSNPFRHAYHHDLPGGPKITRTFEIVFDPGQTLPDRLTGSFKETIKGLVKDDLVLTGRVELRRVSAVNTLEGTP